ncbi:hypothetical protein C8T65DRAFT_738714 [Cerioporus squamosus]|nr:hypothetical protein C8T65DRAFT_738714 [Cerioporus squamosus]
MAPGIMLIAACTLARSLPEAVKDIASSLDADVERFRVKYALPRDINTWSSVLSCRSIGEYDIFSTTTTYQITRYKAMLEELHPGEGELTDRIHKHVLQTSQFFGEGRVLFEQLSKLYDGYFLYLEPSRQQSLEKAHPEFERTSEGLFPRVAATVEESVQLEKLFALVLTEAGHESYTQELESRRAWYTATFPGQISDVVDRLRNLTLRRTEVLNNATAIWDGICTDWFNVVGDRLAPGDFEAALAKYMVLFHELTTQTEQQKRVLGKLRGIVQRAVLYSSTLNAPNEESISIEDIRKAFEQYDMLYFKATELQALCQEWKEGMQSQMAVLEEARESL